MKVVEPYEEIGVGWRAYPDGFFIVSSDGEVQPAMDGVCADCGALMFADGSPLCDCFMGKMYTDNCCSVGEAWPLMTEQQRGMIQTFNDTWDEVYELSPWIEAGSYKGYSVTCVHYYQGSVSRAQEKIIKPNGVVINVH